MLTRNPCTGVPPICAKRQEIDDWSATDATTFLEATATHSMHALYAVALSTGMRQGKLTSLKWSDITLGAGKLHMARSLRYQHGTGLVLVSPKTGRSRRPIKLGMRALESLKAHRKAQLT